MSGTIPLQRIRILHVIAFVAVWMALGWLCHLGSHGYLLLGIPLCAMFHVLVRRQPLSSCWVRDTVKVRLDITGIILALIFLAVPVWQLIVAWTHVSWMLRLYFIAALVGAVGVAFALRHFTRVTLRSLVICLVTAGVIGCSMMILVAYGKHVSAHRPFVLNFGRAVFCGGQFLVLLPVCFVMEEVAFRGVLDAHLHHPGDRRPWLSALLISVLWGWWHLPIAPPSALTTGLIVFPIIHSLVGIPFSLCWRSSGNLLVPSVVHALIDAVRNTVM